MNAYRSSRQFVLTARLPRGPKREFISLFSGAGLGDLGYAAAAFYPTVMVEIDRARADVAAANFPRATVVVGDVRATRAEVSKAWSERERPCLLSATPPCQGMSSSNPSRGKVTEPDEGSNDGRNSLLLSVAPLVKALRPRFVVAENVPQLLKRTIRLGDGSTNVVVKALEAELVDYRCYAGLVQMADYGVPQMRRRSIVVLVHRDERIPAELDAADVYPWPRPTHGSKGRPWITLEQWVKKFRYPSLDAASADTARDGEDPLHAVPTYRGDRYSWISGIPARSGASAYENANCPSCSASDVPPEQPRCHRCRARMTNRPYVEDDDGFRLVAGFKSSYRRMRHDQPAPTVMTNSSSFGSDYKLHPWENRVLSARECADLQTVPRGFQWNAALDRGLNYLVREAVGEAIPPWFTYLHGLVLRDLMDGRVDPHALAPRSHHAILRRPTRLADAV